MTSPRSASGSLLLMKSISGISASYNVDHSKAAFSNSVSQSIISLTPEHIYSVSSTGNNSISNNNNNGITVNESHSSKQCSSTRKISSDRRKRGRPSYQVLKMDTTATNIPIISDSDASENYNPNHFWCPSCCTTYAALTCQIHNVFTQPDTVLSYAKQSLPPSLKLVQKRGRICVILTRRLPVLTKFGPVVAPLVTEEELRENPSWMPDCSFCVDTFGTEAQPNFVQYLRLNDEFVCNWMMFVQRRDCRNKHTNRIPEPNAVAYQQGSDGIFFITTRYIRPGEELVVTYAPPYARRCGITLHAWTNQSCSNKQSAQESATNRVYVSQPDEIHCFRCAVTFNCEDAFRIHCLGHPDELVQRGFLQQPISSSSELMITPENSDRYNGDDHAKQQNPLFRNLHAIYSNRTLYCSLCSVEVNGLGSLIHHNDLMHSVLKPKIFKASISATASADCTLLQPGVNHTDVDTIEHLVGLDQQSCLNATDITSVPFTGLSEPMSEDITMDDDDILVVDLNHASQNLLERPLLWAYGCGGCSQRFPNLLALDQHRQHNCLRPPLVSSASGRPVTTVQFGLGSLTPPSKEQKLKQLRESEALNVPGCSGFRSFKFPTTTVESASVTSASFISQLREATLSDGWRPSEQELPCDVDSEAVSSSRLVVPTVGGTSEAQPLHQGFECDICWARFRTRSTYSVHMRSHDCNTPCSYMQNDNQCMPNSPNMIESGESDAPQVRRTTRIKPRQCQKRGFFCCRVCSLRLDSQTAWRQHSLEHRRASDNRYPCPVCCPEADVSGQKQLITANHRVYETFDQLQRHMRQVHCNHIFPCPYCPSVFGRRRTLVNHLSCHTGQRDFACPQCGRSFARKDNLQRHVKTHVVGTEA